MDLDNNPIDDEGISCLSRLEYIRELRLKSLDISDNCAEVLSGLSSLELLHLGGTNLSCDALLKLQKLVNLKKLLISPEEINKEKIRNFHSVLPDCELIINNKVYRE